MVKMWGWKIKRIIWLTFNYYDRERLTRLSSCIQKSVRKPLVNASVKRSEILRWLSIISNRLLLFTLCPLAKGCLTVELTKNLQTMKQVPRNLFKEFSTKFSVSGWRFISKILFLRHRVADPTHYSFTRAWNR